MKVVCQTLWLPKKGNTEEEYEDAAAPSGTYEEQRADFRCAVADGATETSFSRLWANLLVEGYVNRTDPRQLRKDWLEKVKGKELPWYAEEKIKSGAFAALVGLSMQAGTTSGGTWESEAVGDSCLILLRGVEWVVRFPLTKSVEFNSSPALLSSNPDSQESKSATFTKTSGQWQRGDIFYLLSDAIARWTYLRQEEHGDAAFYLQSLRKQSDMEEFARVQRDLLDAEGRPLMRNDDITMMRVVLE